jgi:hypothetical protein
VLKWSKPINLMLLDDVDALSGRLAMQSRSLMSVSERL